MRNPTLLFLTFTISRRFFITEAFPRPLVIQQRKASKHSFSQQFFNYAQADNSDTKVYFDIAIGDDDENIGQLLFNLKESERLLPLHTENFIKLCTGSVRSVDPRCSYVNCSFKHSPQFVETFPQYRWAHQLDGRGKNAVRADRISDPDSLQKCTHSMYGGVYYGLEYSGSEEMEYGGGVVLTLPLVGAYRGSTSFSIVRVGESPPEWRERLLLNSAVIGYLESGLDVLQKMARQTNGAPTVVASGKIE